MNESVRIKVGKLTLAYLLAGALAAMSSTLVVGCGQRTGAGPTAPDAPRVSDVFSGQAE